MPEERRDMTARVIPLDSREASEPPCPPTIAERLTLVMTLSQEAWDLSGRPQPDYTRATMPIVLRALREQGSD
jgi:hypothetical protein